MKRSIILLAVLFALAIFILPAYAKEPDQKVSEERELFQKETNAVWEDYPSNTVDVYYVPEGKRLVIEFISTLIGTKFDDESYVKYPQFHISTEVNSTRIPHLIPPLIELGTDQYGYTHFRGSQRVLLYADPNTTVKCTIHTADYYNFSGWYGLDISGYLIPVNSSP